MSPPERFDSGLRPEELDPERPWPFETPWGSMVLLLVAGEWRAVQSFCPHLDGPLFQGTRSGDELTCPWHRWRFSLVTGRRTDLPLARDRIRVLAVELGARGTLLVLGPAAGDLPCT